jgi:hypothetical protein
MGKYLQRWSGEGRRGLGQVGRLLGGHISLVAGFHPERGKKEVKA